MRDAHWASEADAWRPPSSAVATARPRFTSYPFTLGVASGAPTPESVVLWTRLAPEPLAGGGVREESVVVRWEVATDDAFRRVVRQGTVDTLAGQGHAVHVPVNGLQANRWHWYRFTAGDDVSPVGRTRTLPASGSNPARLRLAYGSCQQFEQGYYAAHRHILEEDVDFMVFLGDYIYESSWGVNLVRRHAGGEPRTLTDYRNRHAQYKTDPDLQALHAQVPWLVVWDDHEVDNDYADSRSEDLDPQFLARRAAGYQAYFEHMPLPESARPRGPDARIYSRYDFGRLARIHLLDGRQYRTPQACPRPGRGGANVVGEDCRELFDPERTMLSTHQEQWLDDGVRGAAERWNVLAQATLMARADPRLGGEEQFWTDAWDGYPAARTRLLTGLRDRDARSCVVISGDAHATFACDLRQRGQPRRRCRGVRHLHHLAGPAREPDRDPAAGEPRHPLCRRRPARLHGPRHHAGRDPGGGAGDRRCNGAHDRGQHRPHLHHRAGPPRHPALGPLRSGGGRSRTAAPGGWPP